MPARLVAAAGGSGAAGGVVVRVDVVGAGPAALQEEGAAPLRPAWLLANMEAPGL